MNKEKDKKEKAVRAEFINYFHGECWKMCPTCKGNFESYQAIHNNNRCPYCGQLVY